MLLVFSSLVATALSSSRRDYTQQPGVFGSDFRYYLLNNTASSDRAADVGTRAGPTIHQWSGDGVNGSTDFSAIAPALTRVDFDASTKGAAYPAAAAGSNASTYYLDADAFYVVMYGNVSFQVGSTPAPDSRSVDVGQAPAGLPVVHGHGDVFWVQAGQLVYPMMNAGDVAACVQIVTPSFAPKWTTTPPSQNPSRAATDLSTRSYLEREGCAGSGWGPNPSPHSAECLKNGGVYNCIFPAKENTQPVLRVAWAPNCSIPYHYHPTGAMYFIQYGQMRFAGDYADYDATLNKGDVRWVRPGFDYGPEYNTNVKMQITVFGTDSPPTFAAPPAGPYTYTKTVHVSHTFERPAALAPVAATEL